MRTISSRFPALIEGYPVGRQIGPFLFLSGLVGHDSDGFPTSYARIEGAPPYPAQNMSAPDSWEAPLVAQVALAFSTLRGILVEHGSAQDAIVFYGIYLNDMRDYPTLVRMRSGLFENNVTPPCTASQVPGLPYADAVAYFDAVGFKPDPQTGLSECAVVESRRIHPGRLANYQLGTRVGPYLFLAGVVAVEAATARERAPASDTGNEASPQRDVGLAEQLLEAPVAMQTEAICETLGILLEEQGGRLADFAKINIYLTEIRTLPAMERVLRRVFGDRVPAATVIAVQSLARPDFVVEIEGVAYIGETAPERLHNPSGTLSWGANPAACRCGDLVFVSGTVAFDGNLGFMVTRPRDLGENGRRLVEAAITPADGRRAAVVATAVQAWHVIDQIDRILAPVGGLSKVAKLTAYLQDIQNLGALDAVIQRMFDSEDRPALSVLQPKSLPVPGAHVMIEAVAKA